MQQVTTQTEFDFNTKSPININKLNRQNKCVANHLLEVGRLNRHIASELYGIGDLHSRLPETEKYFKERFGIEKIERELKKFVGKWGESRCMEYWLTEEDKIKIKSQWSIG